MDILEYGYKWTMAQQLGYQPITTFWEDFSIAEKFGADAIRNTAVRAFNEWHTNIKFLTELIMVLNHKSWFWNSKLDDYSLLYSKLYYEYDNKALDWLEQHGTEEDKIYYFRTLD